VTTIADITRLVDKIEHLERLERDHLLTLAVMGATDETIAEAAITMTVARFPSPPPPGSLGWGATPADVGRAVVEALRLCGRMPNTQDQQREETR
jgi:hypothetical protein